MYHRQIYCNTEESMVLTWSDNELTTCPTDPMHSVASGSESVVQVARFTHHIKDLFTTTSTSFVPAAKFLYQGSDYYTHDHVPIKYMKISAHSNAGTYNLQLLDETSSVLWSSGTLSNNASQIITVDFDSFTVSTGETLLTLEARGNAGVTCFVSDVSLFSAMVAE